MSENILNREDALQRRHERMRKRHRAQLHRHIILLIGFLTVVMGMLIATSIWLMASYSTPLELPEDVSVLQLTVSDKERLQASDFVEGLQDTGITVSFGADYDGQLLGEQSFTLVFKRGREVCTRIAKVYRFRLDSFLRVQLGQETQVTARDFVADENVQAYLKNTLQEGVSGAFTLTLCCNGKDYAVACVVEETIAPTGVGKELEVQAGSVPDPANFVAELFDHSEVKVAYKDSPSFVMMGTQPVVLLLTDYFGNVSELTATAKVIPAVDGPRFTGLETIYLEQGSGIAYKTGVQATDPQDGELSFTVDPGNFDNQTLGKYTVYYSATDSDGNKLIVPRTVVVESHTAQLLREKVAQILANIIKPNMTRDQQIRAVFNYADWNIRYVNTSDKDSIEKAAYDGLTMQQGDCYTFYAVIRVMLDTLEIPNLECRRVGGTSNHWWNLVEFEDGLYYHVDATSHSIAWFEHFKMTESMLNEYTYNDAVMAHRPNYYVYDHTLPEYQDIPIAQ